MVSLALFAFGQAELSLFAKAPDVKKGVSKVSKVTKKVETKKAAPVQTAAKRTVGAVPAKKMAPKKEMPASTKKTAKAAAVPQEKTAVTPAQDHAKSVPAEGQIYLIDEVVAVVVGETSEVITATDVTLKKTLSGELLSEEKHIENAMIRLDAEKLKVDPTSGEKYLESIGKKNNFSFADKQRMASDLGRTYRELIFLLQHEYIFETWLHYNFKANVVATDEQIEKYAHENPEYEQGWVEISIAAVPYDDATKAEKEEQVKLLVQGEKNSLSVNWAEPIRVMEQEVAQDKLFILSLHKNEMTFQDGDGEFELYKLVEKQPARLKTVDERRAAIIVFLQHDAYMAKCKEYIESMKNNYVVLRVGS